MFKFLFDTYKAFFKKLIQLFFPWNRKVGGKLHVSSKGSLSFKFNSYPMDAYAVFTDEPNVVPCNPCDPGTEDKLFWKVRDCDDGTYVLKIYWDVAGMRTIEWEVAD